MNKAVGVKKVEMSLFNTVEGFIQWEEGPYWTRVQSKLKDRVRSGVAGFSGTFLEVGCGKSVFLPLVRDSAADIVGTDISIGFLKLNSGFQCVLADAEHLPFKDGCVNYLLCVGVVHHVPNQAQMLSELSRITAKSARILMIEPHKTSLNYPYWLLRRILIRLVGWEKVLSIIGFGTPYETFISKKFVTQNLKGFALTVSYYSPFRGLPGPTFAKFAPISGLINDFLEKLPLIRALGTYILLEGSKIC